jgi:small subunit ribosomal protein S17
MKKTTNKPVAVKKAQRAFQGTVVSAGKMKKTIVVRLEYVKTHPKYGKQYARSTKFHVHDDKEEYKVGDVVRFVETRPLSRSKRWRAVGKVTAA